MGKYLVIKGADFSNVAVETLKPYPSEASHYFPFTSNLNDVIGSLVFAGQHSGLSENGVLFTRKMTEGLYVPYATAQGILFEYKYVKSSTGDSNADEYLAAITTIGNARMIASIPATNNEATPNYIYFKGEAGEYETIEINLIDGNSHKIFVGNAGTNAYFIIDGTVVATRGKYVNVGGTDIVIGNGKWLINSEANTCPLEGYIRNLCIFDTELTLARALEITL